MLAAISVSSWAAIRSTRSTVSAGKINSNSLAILYSAVDEENRQQLFKVDLSITDDGEVQGQEAFQLTEEPFSSWDYTVSPTDGSVVYSALTESGTSNLWLVEAGATKPVELLSCPDTACTDVAWSSDGRYLAYSRRSETSSSAPVLGPPRLWLLDMTTRETAPLFADGQQLGFMPRWSADGEWLSYVAPNTGSLNIYHLFDHRTSFYGSTFGGPGIWHPTENVLLYGKMEQINDRYEVHLVQVSAPQNSKGEEGQSTDLSIHEYPVEDDGPSWSPDGEWLAFRRKELAGARESLGKQIWRMRADGRDAEPLTMAVDFNHGSPTWSPDGRYLLYLKFPIRGEEIVISTWVMDVETKEAWEVAKPTQNPLWIP